MAKMSTRVSCGTMLNKRVKHQSLASLSPRLFSSSASSSSSPFFYAHSSISPLKSTNNHPLSSPLNSVTTSTRTTVTHPSHQPKFFSPSHPSTRSFSTTDGLNDPIISASIIGNNSATSHEELITKLERNKLLTDERAKAAMKRVDRKHFCLPNIANIYEDAPLPIGQLATMSAPHAHAIALQYLASKLTPGARVLEIGSGSGYLTACMAILVSPDGHVTAIEHAAPLVERAKQSIRKVDPALIDTNVIEFVIGNGMRDRPDGKYDAIYIGAAIDATELNSIFRQLTPGGLLLAPVIHPYSPASQSLTFFKRLEQTNVKKGIRVHAELVMKSSFAPLRESPPAADVDDIGRFIAETKRLEAEKEAYGSEIKAYSTNFKRVHNRPASIEDLRKDATIKESLQKFSDLKERIAKHRKLIESQQNEANKKDATESDSTCTSPDHDHDHDHTHPQIKL